MRFIDQQNMSEGKEISPQSYSLLYFENDIKTIHRQKSTSLKMVLGKLCFHKQNNDTGFISLAQQKNPLKMVQKP